MMAVRTWTVRLTPLLIAGAELTKFQWSRLPVFFCFVVNSLTRRAAKLLALSSRLCPSGLVDCHPDPGNMAIRVAKTPETIVPALGKSDTGHAPARRRQGPEHRCRWRAHWIRAWEGLPKAES